MLNAYILRFMLQMIFLLLANGLLLNAYASHHIDCSDPANASNAECVGLIDCNDPINLIYPECQGGAVSTPTPAPTPIAPTALFNLSPNSGEAPLAVAVNAAASSDPDGQISAYNWSISDGRSSAGQSNSWTFSNPGTFTITLTVIDNQGLSASSSKTLTVIEAQASAINCMSIYDALENQLSLTWVNLFSGENIVAGYSDVVMRLLSSNDNSLQFQVSNAQAGMVGQGPGVFDCISEYDPETGLLLIPAVKTSPNDASATYKNIRMNLISPAELIFKLEAVESR